MRLALLFLLLTAGSLLFFTLEHQRRHADEERIRQQEIARQEKEAGAPLLLLEDVYENIDVIHEETTEFLELGLLLDELRQRDTQATP